MSVPPSGHRQVSLRGSSAREITRDALLQKVSEERQLRSHLRRAAAAALTIQRVWRRYHLIRKISEQLHEEWEALINQPDINLTNHWISSKMLRPFLFFITQPSSWYKGQQTKTSKSITRCFKIILNSINSMDASKNFCSFAVGFPEERSVWLYQAKKLISLCSGILARCDKDVNMVKMTAITMRLAISLTDRKTWKNLTSENTRAADASVEALIEYIGTRQSGAYSCVRRYIKCFNPHVTTGKIDSAPDDQLLITASAVTVALRPFNTTRADRDADLTGAAKEYFTLILTIPYLCKRLPPLLLPALKHISVLQPSLSILLISKDKIFEEITKLEQLEVSGVGASIIPYCGWALGNLVSLATEHDDLSNSGHFIQGLDCCLYVDAINCISQNLLKCFEESKGMLQCVDDATNNTSITEGTDANDSCRTRALFMDLLKPIYQQWHLRKLLVLTKEDVSCKSETNHELTLRQVHRRRLNMMDVIYFYYYMIRIFSSLNPSTGPLPVLNMLSFTPGFLVDLWWTLEISIFGQATHSSQEHEHNKQLAGSSSGEQISSTRQRRNAKDIPNKWANVLQKITGKSSDADDTNLVDSPLNSKNSNDDALILWDIEAMRQGSEGIGKYVMCMLHLFCAIYGHLLLVLDDIEFYEKQVPFTLEQQRKIASALNTFVYNSFLQNSGSSNKPLIDVAVRCLNLLYERDSRHRFCPNSLWLAPARTGRIPIAAAARAHEAAFATLAGTASGIPTRSSVLTTVPYVYPFEERVQMFREFIELDKTSRRVTGEVSGPGPGSIEIVIRRGHIVEDGYRQLNCLRSKLKSCIHVSFVSECGLPEAGLDYGGLSKEFLTDMSKAAFSPDYGLFSQTSTSDSSLIPSSSAKLLDNGIDMIEFLGRVVGKALYEGILLDYCFSQVFVRKLLGHYSFLDELSTLDSELYRSLMQLKHYEGDVDDLCLDFTLTEELGGKRIVHELRPGGKNISVTNENRLHYVHAMADFKLNHQILPFSNAFYRGLSDLISPSWLSLFNANEFNQRMEEAVSKGSSNHVPVLSILAKDINDLATKERNMYSPILKEWHPFASGVAVATLHFCFGNELKQFIAGITKLTPDTAQVLNAADKLEKNLVNIAVEDSVDSDDGGKSLIRQMPPYEAENAIANLVKAWVNERVEKLEGWIDQSLQQETWNPKANRQSVAPSSVEMLKIIDEMLDAFFQLPISMHSTLFPDLAAGLDRILHHYVSKEKSCCGTRSTPIPKFPRLTRCDVGSKLFKKKEKPHVVMKRGSQVGSSAGNGACASDLPKLCVQINTLHYIRSEVENLKKKARKFLRNNELAQDGITDGMNINFKLSEASCQDGIRQLCDTTAYNVVFSYLSHVLLDTLYVGGTASNRVEPLLRELHSILGAISGIMHNGARDRLLAALMKASFDGFLLVLLAGGPTRAFSLQDSQTIENDFRALRRLYLANGDGLPDELVDKASSEVKNILPLLSTDTESLIQRFKQTVSECNGSPTKSRFPIPPVPTQWSANNPNTILRVLCYRNDEIASKFLKKTYNLPKNL